MRLQFDQQPSTSTPQIRSSAGLKFLFWFEKLGLILGIIIDLIGGCLLLLGLFGVTGEGWESVFVLTLFLSPILIAVFLWSVYAFSFGFFYFIRMLLQKSTPRSRLVIISFIVALPILYSGLATLLPGSFICLFRLCIQL